MNCSIIFYMAHKTSYCETSLKNVLIANDIHIEYVYPSFSADMLAENINSACEKSDLIFVLGGLSKPENINTLTIISKGFNNLKPLPKVQEITNPLKGENGYLLTYFKQNIVLLPDDPEQIASMVSKKLVELIKE